MAKVSTITNEYGYEFGDVSTDESDDNGKINEDATRDIDTVNDSVAHQSVGGQFSEDDDALGILDDEDKVEPQPDSKVERRLKQRRKFRQTEVRDQITRKQMTAFEFTKVMMSLVEQMKGGMPVPNAGGYAGEKKKSDKELAALHILEAGFIITSDGEPQWKASHILVNRQTDMYERCEETYTLRELLLDKVSPLLYNILGKDVFLSKMKTLQRLNVVRLDELILLQILADTY